MAEGRIFKRCGCRDPQTGRMLGRNCRKLRRGDGRWNPRHGSWVYQLELPPAPDGTRRNPLRRGGFARQDDAETELGQARELLAISTDPAVRDKIAELILATVKKTRSLPEPDTVRRKVRTGQDINRHIRYGDWLDRWLKGKKRISDGTRARYASDVRLYLKPYLGHIEVEKLRVADFADMFDAIAEYNDLIREARASGDPKLRAKVKWRRPVTPATMRHIKATARHSLNVAVKQERLIDFNPAAIVELPPTARPKPLVWTSERVPGWQADHKRHLAAARERAGGRQTYQPHRDLLRHTTAVPGHGVDPDPHPRLPPLRRPASPVRAVPAHRRARATPRRSLRRPPHRTPPHQSNPRHQLADHHARL
jgi:hypothetical protein